MTVKKFLSTEWTLNSKQFLKVHLKLIDQFWLLTQHWNGIYQLQTALPEDLRVTSWVGWLQTIKKKNHKLVYTQTHTHRPDSYRTQKSENTSFSIQIVSHLTAIWQNINFCFIDYAKAFDCVDHNKLWKTLKEMGIPDHLTCLLKSLYTGQEATVRTGHGTTY